MKPIISSSCPLLPPITAPAGHRRRRWQGESLAGKCHGNNQGQVQVSWRTNNLLMHFPTFYQQLSAWLDTRTMSDACSSQPCTHGCSLVVMTAAFVSGIGKAGQNRSQPVNFPTSLHQEFTIHHPRAHPLGHQPLPPPLLTISPHIIT